MSNQYQNETKNCQNCKNDFTIEPDDFGFYEKIGVLAPDICHLCRAQHRLYFRNERVFYKRPCDKCKKDVISTYSPNKSYVVWCYECYFSDHWDASDYSLEYDEKLSFCEQLKILDKNVPKVGLVYVRSPESSFTHISADNKSCYMIVESSNNENCINCYWIQRSKDLIDCSFTHKVELSYEVDDCYDSSKLRYSKGCHGCFESYFLLDCIGLSNCFGCVNLRQKQYCIFNEQYSKNEYFDFIKKMKLDTYSGVKNAKEEVIKFFNKNPRKFAKINKTLNSTGNYIKNTKNCLSCFHAYDSENCKYGVHTWENAKDCMDVDTAGRNAELIYNSINSGIDTSNHISTNLCWSSTYAFYSSYCFNSNNILGCFGLRKKNYCILNKEYLKDEYEILKLKIFEELRSSNTLGQFFSKDFGTFGYNESAAFEQFPLSKEEALTQGFKWEDTPRGTYGKETIDLENFPDSISDLPEDFDINKEIFVCIDCKKNYKVINDEFSFYRRMNLPIPRVCPECRHAKRYKNRGPNKLWHCTCMCDKTNHIHGDEHCAVKFETSYAPDRPEVVYCEKCYQQEVY